MGTVRTYMSDFSGNSNLLKTMAQLRLINVILIVLALAAASALSNDVVVPEHEFAATSARIADMTDEVSGSSYDTNMRVLVVQHDFTDRQMTEDKLTELGITHNVFWADDADTALPMLVGGGEYDFVITDWDMPQGMQGIDLLRAIRADATLRHTPVLVVMAEAKKDQIIEAAQAEVNGYIVKPFTAGTLKTKLDRIFARRG